MEILACYFDFNSEDTVFEYIRESEVKSLSCVWLFVTPMDCSPLDSSVHGIFQARVLEWVAISFSRGSSQPRDQTCVSCHSCSKNGSVPSEPWRTKFIVSVVFLLVTKYWDPQQNTAGLGTGLSADASKWGPRRTAGDASRRILPIAWSGREQTQ